MQNSELFRRGVVLPLDLEAEKLLRVNEVSEEMAVRYVEIPDQSFFEILWNLGLFQAINARSGSLLDDYEEAFIEASAVNFVLDSIDEVKTKEEAQHIEVRSFLNELSRLAVASQELKRPLLFVL
jgi:hypothetical protein